MAEQRSLANSVAQAELLAHIPPSQDNSAVKVQAARRWEQNAGRPVSGPVSLELPLTDERTPHHQRSTSAHVPPKEIAGYRVFRQLCDEFFNELRRIDSFFVDDIVGDEGSQVIVEIEELLEALYECPFGSGESLKRVVVAVQSQVNNAQWTRQHVAFLKDTVRFLRVRYLVDEKSVQMCYELMKARGLDPFRGTVCEPQVLKMYHIAEVDKK